MSGMFIILLTSFVNLISSCLLCSLTCVDFRGQNTNNGKSMREKHEKTVKDQEDE